MSDLRDHTKRQFRAFRNIIRRYFTAYGGFSAVFTSPLFIFSFVLSAVSYRKWVVDNWSDSTLSILPNLLGFSLGAYSIIFSILTHRMRMAIKSAKNGAGNSYFDEINSAFFHFIFVQVLAILWAFIYRGSLLADLAFAIRPHCSYIWAAYRVLAAAGGFVGYTMLLYAVALVIASAVAVYRLASIADPNPPED